MSLTFNDYLRLGLYLRYRSEHDYKFKHIQRWK
jgi:hypothetical protein